MHANDRNDAFLDAAIELLERTVEKIGIRDEETVEAVVAGGLAVHLYTGARVSDDIDAVFSERMLFPGEMMTTYLDERGTRRTLSLDRNYFAELGLLHPDALDDARFVRDIAQGKLKLKVLSPLDLAVTKTARFQDQDREDIRALASLDLLDPDAYERRAREALSYYVGNTFWVEANIRDAAEIIRHAVPPDEDTANDPRPGV